MLFVKNLPKHFTRQGLRSFVLMHLKSDLQSCSLHRQSLLHCEIMRVTDRNIENTEHYGLIEVAPAKLALRAIDVLNGQEIAGQKVEVHRYCHRASWGQQSGDVMLARRGIDDRRRRNLKFDLVHSPAPRGLLKSIESIRVILPRLVGSRSS
jgi:hypothetical protein